MAALRPLVILVPLLATLTGTLAAQIVAIVPVGTVPHPKVRWANTTGNTVTFDVINQSSTTDYSYDRTCGSTGNVTVTNCPLVGLIGFGTTKTVTVTFSVGAAGTAT